MKTRLLFGILMCILLLMGCQEDTPIVPQVLAPTQQAKPLTRQHATPTEIQYPPPWTRSPVPPQLQTDLARTPTATPITTPLVPSTAQAKDGLFLQVLIYSVGDPNEGNPTYKVGVKRGKEIYWLKPSNRPHGFGCEREESASYTYGCYGVNSSFLDLDAGSEPEVVSWAEHNSSCGVQSFHVHEWNGNGYQLMGEFSGCGLQTEIKDLNDDDKPEILIRSNVGVNLQRVTWFDIYTLENGKLTPVNAKYPELYKGLLQKYRELKRDYEKLAASSGLQEGLDELLKRTKMAEEIVNGK